MQRKENKGRKPGPRCLGLLCVNSLPQALWPEPDLHPRREIGAGERKEPSLSPASRGITNSYKQLICRKRNESKFMLPMLNI